MNWNNAKHEATCVTENQYPPADLPEIVLSGRSNVGKSSLINSLTNIKSLARVGQTPGKTRQIIFFNIDEKLRFVDLPGYGYAKVSKTEQASWKILTDTYFNAQRNVGIVIQLLDIRRDPTDDDIMMMSWMNNIGLPYIVVAVKSDKFSKSKVRQEISRISRLLSNVYRNPIIPFSSLKKEGVDELRETIESVLNENY